MTLRGAAPYLAVLALVGLGYLAQRSLTPSTPDAGPLVRLDALWSAHLPDLEGRPQALEQWRGKVLVLNFWAPWCPPCRREIPGFIALQKQYAAQGVQFVGVALDDPERVREFAQEHGINYPILLGGDAAMRLAQDAGSAGGLPYSVVFNRRGESVNAITGEIVGKRLETLLKPLL
ncbi:MAG: TlpA family protein disulfide reductase [Betaproteobacteria bacterium]|nr:TlpA family protein disulfide reductase [Betaproteobacteria bacterium]